MAFGPKLPLRDQIRQWFFDALETEAKARSGFFLVPIGLMIGIALYYGLGLSAPIAVSLPAALVVLGLGIAVGRGRMLGGVLTLCGCACLGMALSSFEVQRAATTTFSGEATVRIDGIVAWRDVDDRGRVRYLVEIDKTERPVLSRPPKRAQILVSSKHQVLAIGQRYAGLVRLRAPAGPAYPGGYDFAFGTYFTGLGAYGYGLGPPRVPAVGTPSGLKWAQSLVALRLFISDRIRETIGGGAGAVASALITGERSGIPDDIDLWLRATGLSHVLSISGLHMALVAGFAMALVRGALAAIPLLALTLPTKKIAAMAALVVSSFYLVLSGDDVATERSYVMLAIMLLSIPFDRPSLTLRNVGMAAVVVLAIRPHALMTASFQMSFAATAALVGVYGAFSRWRNGRKPSGKTSSGRVAIFLVAALGLAASSTIAGLATAPYAAYHFQRIAPFGLFANMLAVPIFSFWIMPLALIAMLAMPFGLDGLPLVLLGYGLELVFEISRRLYEVLPDRPTGLVAPAGLACLTFALFIACLFASRLKWIALPLAVTGLVLAPTGGPPPELLVFEDGQETATIDADLTLHPVKSRPNRFVYDQWARAYPGPYHPAAQGSAPPTSAEDFACETIAAEPPRNQPTAIPPSWQDASSASMGSPPSARRPPKPKTYRYCRGMTRSGLAIVWTDDYRRMGQACDEADIAIVARAVRLEACRSGAVLVTLKTLRRTGSLAISRRTSESLSPAAGDGPPKPVAFAIDRGISVTRAIPEPFEPWNVHRAAPWPEHWRQPKTQPDNASPPDPKSETSRP